MDRGSRLLSVEGGALLQLMARDHIGEPGSSLAGGVRAHLAACGFEASGWRITLIAYPRVLGYVFNPVSFYLCHDADGILQHAIAEVHNTHGEREVYDFTPEEAGARVFTSTVRKRFYVSPFIGPEAEYRIRVVEDASQLAISLFESEQGIPVLDAGVRLRRLPMTDGNLARLVASDPAMGLKTIALIGWHAARLWLMGVPWDRFRRKAEYVCPR